MIIFSQQLSTIYKVNNSKLLGRGYFHLMRRKAQFDFEYPLSIVSQYHSFAGIPKNIFKSYM